MTNVLDKKLFWSPQQAEEQKKAALDEEIETWRINLLVRINKALLGHMSPAALTLSKLEVQIMESGKYFEKLKDLGWKISLDSATEYSENYAILRIEIPEMKR